jgi:hypothetical protein
MRGTGSFLAYTKHHHTLPFPSPASKPFPISSHHTHIYLYISLKPFQPSRIKQEAIMSGFPSLQPAFTVRVAIDAPMKIGGQAGSQLVVVPMVSGSVKSEEGFGIKLDGEL